MNFAVKENIISPVIIESNIFTVVKNMEKQWYLNLFHCKV